MTRPNWPPRYLSRFFYLIDWCDASPREAQVIVEREMKDDAEFERGKAA